MTWTLCKTAVVETVEANMCNEQYQIYPHTPKSKIKGAEDDYKSCNKMFFFQYFKRKINWPHPDCLAYRRNSLRAHASTFSRTLPGLTLFC